MASGLLFVFLIAIFIILLPRPVPAIQFVSIPNVTAELTADAPFPAPGSFGAVRNSDHLQALFQASADAEPQLILPPVRFDTLSQLESLSLAPNRRLIVYVSAQVRISNRSSGPLLELGYPEGNQLTWIAAQDFFQTFFSEKQFSPPLLTLLLLELENLDPGLTTGESGIDVQTLLHNAVVAVRQPRLAVMCACGSGQRSWEYIAEPSDAVAAAAQSSGSPVIREGQRQGTAFGHFVAQAILDARSERLGDFFASVRDDVRRYVEDHYGAQQDVQLILFQPDSRNAPLFVGIHPPSGTDVRQILDPPDESSDEPGVETAAADGKPPEGENGETAEPEEPPRDQLIAEFWEQQNDFQNKAGGMAVAGIAGIQAAALRSEQLLLHRRLKESDRVRSLADSERRKQQRHVEGLMQGTILSGDERSASVLGWLYPNVRDAVLTPANTDACIDCIQSLASGDAAKVGRPPEQRTPEFLQQLTTWLIRKLESIPNDAEARAKELATLRAAFLQKDQSGWNPQRYPHQLVTLMRLLASDQSPDSPVEHWKQIETGLRLIRLRDQVLTLTVGLSPGSPDVLLRRSLWQKDVSGASQRLMTKLTAAESWLNLGPEGLVPATELLRQAQGEMGSLLQTVQDQLALQHVVDAQEIEIPYLIQFLAARFEAEELDDRTLEDFIEMQVSAADASGAPRVVRRPDRPTELQMSMLALTEDLSGQQAVPLREHYSRLWKEINDAAVAPAGRLTASSLRQLELIPPFPEFESRRAVFADSQQLAAPRIQGTPGTRTHSGFWMTYWSIRLLETRGVPRTVTEPLWQEWDRLRTQLMVTPVATSSRGSEVADEETIESRPPGPVEPNSEIAVDALTQIRASLREQLTEAWASVSKVPAAQPTSAFVSFDDMQPVLAAMLAERRIFRWELASQPSLAHSVEGVAGLISECDSSLVLSGQGAARVSVKTRDATVPFQLYLLVPKMTSDQIVGKNDAWIRVLDYTAGNATTSHEFGLQTADSAEPLTGAVTARLLAVTSDMRVIEERRIQVFPNPTTGWKLHAEHRDRSVELVTVGQDSFNLLLPPSLPREKPASVRFVLTRQSGIAESVRVQLFPLSADGLILEKKPVWPEPQLLDLDPIRHSVNLPLASPASAVPAADAPGSVPLDLTHGFCLRATPVFPGFDQASGDAQTRVTDIRVHLVSYGADTYVQRPEPVFDPLKRTLRIPVRPAVDRSLIPLEKLPMQVHFSPPLRGCLVQLSGDRRETVTADGDEFLFEFRSEVAELPRDGAEFSMSVVGIPHAWAWRLTQDGRIEPLGEHAEPDVRVELLTGDVTPLTFRPDLLLNEQALKTPPEPVVHIHGGVWRTWREVTLSLQLAQDYPERATRTLRTLSNLNGPNQYQVDFQPGENGVWNVTTETRAWTAGVLEMQKNGLQSGRYTVIAELKYESNGTQQLPPAARVPFVVDATPPENPEIRLPEFPAGQRGFLFNRPLKVEIQHVSDPESGVVRVAAGMNSEKPVVLWEKLPQGRPLLNERTFSCTISPEEFGEIPGGDTDKVVERTIHVRVDNAAGLSTPRQFNVRIVRPAGSTPDENRGPIPGTFAFIIDDAVKGMVTISVDGRQKTGQAGSVIRFTGLTEGQYTVRCEMLHPVLKTKFTKFEQQLTLEKEGSVKDIRP
ncbi:MAG: hypothetical protein KDA96_04045 [Planctomycetaceae bacterium]|nr:hypothetical protein [Planctomycetaceae bacterium]